MVASVNKILKFFESQSLKKGTFIVINNIKMWKMAPCCGIILRRLNLMLPHLEAGKVQGLWNGN